MLPIRSTREPGSSTFSTRRHLPGPTGSVAAAWQAAALGKQFQAFSLGGNRYSPTKITTDNSSLSTGRVPARSPIRTPARKSVVGSPRTKFVTPAVASIPNIPAIERHGIGVSSLDHTPSSPTKKSFHVVGKDEIKIKSPTYDDQMGKTTAASPKIKSSSPAVQKRKDPTVSTYADQMALIYSKISSEHTPSKPEGMLSPKRPPAKIAALLSQSLDGSRYVSHLSNANKVGLLNCLPLGPLHKQWKEVGIHTP